MSNRNPFAYAALFLLLIFIFLVLAISSIVYIPLRVKNQRWKSLFPVGINTITILSMILLFSPFRNFWIAVNFQTNERDFTKIIYWVSSSIQDGSLRLAENNADVILLPTEYKELLGNDRIVVERISGNEIGVFFMLEGGMFEYSPSYMYRSDIPSLPIESGDTVCLKEIKPHWYFCT